jgi:feruloyl-CoA synthase
MGGVLQDLVIGGENRDSLIALVWLNPDRARQHATGATGTDAVETLAADPGVCAYIHRVLDENNHAATSSARISAVAIQLQPPSLAAGETTDKGYINQRAVFKNRAAIVDSLYAGATSPHIVRLHSHPRALSAAGSAVT